MASLEFLCVVHSSWMLNKSFDVLIRLIASTKQVLFLSREEVLRSVTWHAARALDLAPYFFESLLALLFKLSLSAPDRRKTLYMASFFERVDNMSGRCILDSELDRDAAHRRAALKDAFDEGMPKFERHMGVVPLH